MKLSKPVQNLLKTLRSERDDAGAAPIRSKEVAVLIRYRLARIFPGVKFSVRSDWNTVRVSWTDGPVAKLVESEINEYSFGGFDGTIDLAYSCANWLHPDGSMSGASCLGTEGSSGYVPAYATDCPEPGAILVQYGPKYIFTRRTVTPGKLAELVLAAADHYGFEVDAQTPVYNQMHKGFYITDLAYRLERETAAEAFTRETAAG